MSNKNLTKTLFADFRKVDTKKLNINGNPFSKVVTDHVPVTPTENDYWKYAVTTDDNGVVIITDDVAIDYYKIPTAILTITKTAAKVIDNKVLNSNNSLLMNWDTKNFTNEKGISMISIFNKSSTFTEWDSDLSSLTSGYLMFYRTALASFNGDLSSLTDGRLMFYDSSLTSFDVDMPSLTDGNLMFYSTALKLFRGDLSSLTNAYLMFHSTALKSFDIDLPSLENGNNMFGNCSSLASFESDLSSLKNGSDMFLGTAFESFDVDMPSLTDGSYMFRNTPLQSFSSNLSSLKNGEQMFTGTPLTSFDVDMPSLTDSINMFASTGLESFSSDLSSLTDGDSMFWNTPIQSFNGDLSSLVYGYHMFYGNTLASFCVDLPNLINGDSMFYKSALESFNGDLSSLVYGYNMFINNQPRHYEVSRTKMIDGTRTYVTETVVSNGLKSFISNLSSLKSGYGMFGTGGNVTYTYTDDSGTTVTETTKDVAPLDEESIMLIADTINDISSLDKTLYSDWLYIDRKYEGELSTAVIYTSHRGKLHLGYDSSITDMTNIFKYCDEIVAKGWTVYLNGSDNGTDYEFTNSGSAALIDGESSTTPIPHYYKPVQVTDEDIAEYVDANNNYYIIVGGQHVFGDDISTYGMFTSYRHAVQEITTALGLTKYEKPSTETNNN